MITSSTAIARRALSRPHMVRRVSSPAVGTPKKPIGAFRGGLFGFLLGSTVSGSAAYYYLMREYKVSNELLAADIEELKTSTQKVEAYVKALEERIETQSSVVVKKKKQ